MVFKSNWYDYGARFYDPVIGRFHTPDPLSDEYRSWTNYHYVHNNPINLIDPTGMAADWVQNNETKEFEWKDDVTTENNTPEGYTYVGAKDEDLLTYLNIPTETEPISVAKIGGTLEESNGGIALVRTKTETQGTIKTSAIVSRKAENVTSNNKGGLKFEGVKVEATFVQSSKSGNPDLKMSYGGQFSVQYGSETGNSMLKPASGSYLAPTGSSVSQTNLAIPADILDRNKSFSATIQAGTTTPGLFYRPLPISMTWNNK